ncbi:unnamed protein product [Blepharisma stoltei]|uniref:Cyclin-dependent kinase 2 homolog n=1 Tax=Blepharisma stoltei TaxID=1481888 RepID=A0AAU9J3B6_9CILI|nr:unnamed protein product [Blepharisma stoltei]
MEQSRYIRVRFLGKGTYGEVHLYTDTQTDTNVAIKTIKVLQEGEGIHFTALREIMILQELIHPNIIRLHDVFYKNSNINLVLELAESALNDVIHLTSDESTTKGLLKQLLEGLAFMHENSVMHRDLKPGNLLISRNGQIKITDFGTAKIVCDVEAPRTTGVCTLWYQSPELLFGTKHYGKAMDMWSVGCIFAEMINKEPFLKGNTSIDQINKIFNTLGTPGEEDWKGMNILPNYWPSPASPRISFVRAFPTASNEARDLLEKMLMYDPRQRISASQALQHPYFSTGEPHASCGDIARILSNYIR